MVKNEEIISDLRNKLQVSSIVIERLNQGKPIPENLIKIAKSNIEEIEKLLSDLEGLQVVQQQYERSL